MCINYTIYKWYRVLVYRGWKHTSFLNLKQNYEPTGYLAKIEKMPGCHYYTQTRTFIKLLVPEIGANNKKYYKEKKLIG